MLCTLKFNFLDTIFSQMFSGIETLGEFSSMNAVSKIQFKYSGQCTSCSFSYLLYCISINYLEMNFFHSTWSIFSFHCDLHLLWFVVIDWFLKKKVKMNWNLEAVYLEQKSERSELFKYLIFLIFLEEEQLRTIKQWIEHNVRNDYTRNKISVRNTTHTRKGKWNDLYEFHCERIRLQVVVVKFYGVVAIIFAIFRLYLNRERKSSSTQHVFF